MSSSSLVSVILIFFDCEKFITEAIESVCAQSYVNWELLLVDDGSTDGGTEIALRYAARSPDKVRYLEHAAHLNRGMSASRNLGLKCAKGEYVAFIDADDVWLTDKLTEQVRILTSQPEAALVCGSTLHWYSWTGDPVDAQRDFVQDLGVALDRLIWPPDLLAILLRNQVVTSTGSLARREFVEDIGGFEEQFRGMYEDQAFFSKVCLRAPVFLASGCWYRYRRHPDSNCSIATNSGQHYSHRLVFLRWLEGYLSEQGVTDTGLWQALKSEQRKSRHPGLYRLSNQSFYRVRIMKEILRSTVRRTLPAPLYRWLRDRLRGRDQSPPVGLVNLGDREG